MVSLMSKGEGSAVRPTQKRMGLTRGMNKCQGRVCRERVASNWFGRAGSALAAHFHFPFSLLFLSCVLWWVRHLKASGFAHQHAECFSAFCFRSSEGPNVSFCWKLVAF